MKMEFNDTYKGMKCRVCLVRENTDCERIPIFNQSDAYGLVKDDLTSSDREVFLSLLLTAKNHLIGVETVSIGSITAATISARDVFKSALLVNAVSLIFCHNHPSGDLTPSKEDIKLTEELIKAGELLGVNVLDHLIVSHQGYKSLRDCVSFPK